MTTIPHEPASAAPGRPGWPEVLTMVEVWASLAITAMWVAVAICAVYGPDIVVVDNPTSSTSVPSGVVVALFAWLGSAAVARYAFRRSD